MKNTYSKHLLALLFILLPVGIVIPATALTTDKDINSSTGLSIDTEMTETKRGDLSSGTPFETELSLASGLLTIKDIKGTANNVIVHTVNGGTLRITNHDNLLSGAAPTDIQIDGANTDSVNENRLVGAVVGVLTTTDSSTVDSHSYALVTGSGDTDNASFQISGDELLTNAVFDFESKNTYSIRVRTTDTSSQSYEEVLSITVNDITNETNTSTQTLWNLNTAGNYTASSTLAIDVSTGIGQLFTGSFTADNIEVATDNSRHSTVADFNADGNLDIYVSNFGQNKLWLGDGAGNWTLDNIEVATDNSRHSSVADFNADGNLDVYVSNYNGQNKLWLEDGAGNWTLDNIETATDLSYHSSVSDFDEDGHLDIYVSNYIQQNKLWLGDGTGNWTLDNIEVATDDSFHSSVADFNADGHLDIYVSNDGQNKLWLGDGAGNWTPDNIETATDFSVHSSVADFNADGHLDIYVSNDGEQNKLWLGDGAGNWTLDTIEVATDRSVHSSVADFNADGQLDIYVSNYNQQNKLWLNGFSQDSPYITANTAQTFTTSLTGFTETLSANNQGTVSYQVSTDNGTTWNYWNGTAWTVTTKTDGTETSSATVINSNIATLDTDGGDFLWRAYLTSNGTQRVELDQVEVSFVPPPPPTDLQIDGANTDSVNENRLVGAVVGVLTTTDSSTVDSHSYALVSGTGDTDNTSFQISGDELSTNAIFDFESKNAYSIRVRTTDSDSQSYEEALTITVNDITNETNTSTQTLWNLNTAGDYTASSTLAIDVSTGIGQLTTGSFTADNIETATDLSFHSSVADFNADGKLDIYVSNQNQQNKLWLGDGAGNWTLDNIEVATDNSVHSSVADFNADGNLDIYISNYAGQNKLWLGDGAGNWTLDNIELASDRSYHSSVADFNADGNLDIYVSNDGVQNKLWLGDGAGNWTLDNIELASDRSYHSSVADFNADGHLDIYVSNGGQNKLWLGDGAGGWTLDNIEVATDNSIHSSVADFNADGHLDIYVSNYNGQNKLWLGDGAGGWTLDNIEVATDSSFHSSVADFNADGHLDIYVSNNGEQNKLWLGDGAGGWTLDNIEVATDASRYSSVADFNADGHLDIYVSNYGGQNKLWLNGFSTTNPYITLNTAQTFATTLTGFTQTLSANNQGTVTYQVSTNNGTTWNYWNGTAWTVTTKTDGTETSSATVINTNIGTLDTDGGAFLWRAFFHSNGTQRVELDQVEVSYATELPMLSAQCNITLTPPSINAYGGTVTATTTDATVLTTQGTHTLNWLFGSSGTATATTASQTVVIKDTTPPDAVVLPIINQQCAATLIPPSTTDNCAGIVTATTSSVLQINSQGSRIISWTFADGNGNSLVVTQTVVINDSSAPIAPVLTSVNASDTITLAVPTALDNCSGMVTGQTTSNLTISSEGTHRIVWTFTDGVGNQSTAEQVVVLNRSSGGSSTPEPEMEPDPCDTDTVAPVAPVLAPISDSCEVVIPTPTALDACSGSVHGTTDAPLTYSQVGDYSITWIFTDSSGNQSTAVQEVSILYDQEVVEIHNACESFEWIDGVRYTEDNNTATYETIDAQGCITLHRLELTLDTLEQPSIALEGNALVVETLADNYQWLDCDNGNAPIAGATQPRFTPDRLTGNYAVRVTKGSCVVTSECKQLLPEEAVNVSQAFSPNGDGINDTWYIEHIEKFPNASVRVFNKTGNEVFASENGYNNDWNGAWKGSQNVLPSGSYFYTVDREGDGIVDQYGWLYIQ